MSKRETSGDACGWKRGQKGYATGGQWDKSNGNEFSEGNYNKERNINRERPVGQFAVVADSADGKQRGY